MQKNLEWATAHLYCKKKKLYCRKKKNQCIAMGIVLQDGCRRPKCVAIQNCIVTRGVGTGRRLGAGLGVAAGEQGAQAGSWARRRQAAGAGGTGVRALGSRGRAGQAVADARQGEAAARGARQRSAGLAGSGQQARGQARRGRASARRLGVLAGSTGLVWCTVHLAQL